jgi:hypothetical protein
MEIEDLQLLALGHVGEATCDVLLYDPMPGGSGLLEHLAERWDEVRNAALDLLTMCPSACESACIDCLHTYRNRFYHEYLDRHVAHEVLTATTGPLVAVHPIPEHLPKTQSTTGQSQTWVESRFKQFISQAGLPAPICQRRIDLGRRVWRNGPRLLLRRRGRGRARDMHLRGRNGRAHPRERRAEREGSCYPRQAGQPRIRGGCGALLRTR